MSRRDHSQLPMPALIPCRHGSAGREKGPLGAPCFMTLEGSALWTRMLR